jgi:hypothetical protein
VNLNERSVECVLDFPQKRRHCGSHAQSEKTVESKQSHRKFERVSISDEIRKAETRIANTVTAMSNMYPPFFHVIEKVLFVRI